MPVFSRLSLHPLGEDHAMGQLCAILDQPAQAEVNRVVHNGRCASKNHVQNVIETMRACGYSEFSLKDLVRYLREPIVRDMKMYKGMVFEANSQVLAALDENEEERVTKREVAIAMAAARLKAQDLVKFRGLDVKKSLKELGYTYGRDPDFRGRGSINS